MKTKNKTINLINVITKYNQKLKQDIDFQTKIKQFIIRPLN